MDCETNDIKDESEALGQISHHVIRAGHMALFGDVEGAEKEMEIVVILLKSIQL